MNEEQRNAEKWEQINRPWINFELYLKIYLEKKKTAKYKIRGEFESGASRIASNIAAKSTATFGQ
jgi:hypothetical protein